MSDKERAIVALLKQNPYSTQQQIAEEIGLSRPAVANMISAMQKKGYIIGRAYILPTRKEIICVGGANIDRKFFLKKELIEGTSNPVSVSESVGGVARNIAENLGRMEHTVRLLTVAGKDADWEKIASKTSGFAEVQSVKFSPTGTTGSYSAVVSPSGEMDVAFANMDIYEELSPTYLEEQKSFLRNASLLISDLNVPKESVTYLRDFAKEEKIPLAIIPVSSPKMDRLPAVLEGIDWLICNKDEAETLLNTSFQQEEAVFEALETIQVRGVRHVIITSGAKGVYVKSDDQPGFFVKAITPKKVVDVTGAGDAFVSATLNAFLAGNKIEDCVQAGLVHATATIESTTTVLEEI
ncbi:carbohydrate kinase [Paenisporosarcina cavernae]|uniref:Winged helix-turn-helix transcriptional regulator n=1 Tax=Paenisporosarcina cavernae TaxID=2320858 RepID=A0A385YTR5_9BACL|nr:carbohydrate kinase [Paenisporosarcina cavernae]AYC30249.1 winged helix-turn-helix transcriptional regulator [Paenisporosarcina cavernae]